MPKKPTQFKGFDTGTRNWYHLDMKLKGAVYQIRQVDNDSIVAEHADHERATTQLSQLREQIGDKGAYRLHIFHQDARH